MIDKREPNTIAKASKQQLPKVNSTIKDMVIQNKDRHEVYNTKEEFAKDIYFENNTDANLEKNEPSHNGKNNGKKNNQ